MRELKEEQSQKLVSVIVSNYNGKKYLDGCLNSLQEQTYPAIEIILSDDASSDGSVDLVKANFPDVKVTVNKINRGLAVTSNNGALLANGEYLFFFNNDTIAFPDLILNLVTAIERNQEAGMAYPVSLPFDPAQDNEWEEEHTSQFMACGTDIYGYPCRALTVDKVFYPDAGIFIKRNVFDEIGGFDNDFLLYGEDIDISWRVHLLGYKIVYVEEARFRHDSDCMRMEGDQVVTNISRRMLVERQVINMMLKYYSIRTILWLFPRFLIFFTAEALYFLFIRMNFTIFSQVYCNAIWWNIKRWPVTLKKRRIIQEIRVIDDRQVMEIMYHGYAKLETIRRLGVPVMR